MTATRDIEAIVMPDGSVRLCESVSVAQPTRAVVHLLSQTNDDDRWSTWALAAWDDHSEGETAYALTDAREVFTRS